MLRYPHDIVKLSRHRANANSAEFIRLYQKGLSLNEVSEQTGFPVTTIRSILVSNQIPLRAANKSVANDPSKPSRTFWGGIPYGYCVLDGQVVPHPAEIKVIRQILAHWKKGMSFNAIKKWLNNQKNIK